MSDFASFAAHEFALGEATIFARVGGAGPPLLLLHGYPQSHLMWARVADALAVTLHAGRPGFARLRPILGAALAPGRALFQAGDGGGRARADGGARSSKLSRWRDTIAAAASPTGWRSIIPTR